MPKRGRPKGSKNKSVPTIDVVKSVCPTCGSSKRSPYFNKREKCFIGVDRDGNVFEKVTWRRTKCLDCGQHRDDRTYTYKK